jgi:hypothetical protein
VSQLAVPSLKFHSRVRAGNTAEPLNHSDIPSNSATASSASVRQRDGVAAFDKRETELCKAWDCNLSGGSVKSPMFID